MELSASKMFEMQRVLQEKYLEQWGGLSPRKARDCLLWAVIEAGEAADIIKKQGDEAVMADANLRRDFIEEVGDVMMYLVDALLCYGVKPEELSEVYTAKFERNMKRW